MTRPNDVISFWIDEVGPQGWYRHDPELDATIVSKFQDTWETLSKADCEGKELEEWFKTPETVLALIIVLDQFSRNMFREDPRAFSSDARARAIAQKAIIRKTGARGLRSIIEAILLETMFDLPGMEGVEEVVISEEVVNGNTQPLYIYADKADEEKAESA